MNVDNEMREMMPKITRKFGRLVYYYTTDPNNDYEVDQLLELAEDGSSNENDPDNYWVIKIFFFVPDDVNYGDLVRKANQSKARWCLWTVPSEDVMNQVVEMWQDQTITREKWKSLGARRSMLTHQVLGEDESEKPILYDWVLDEFPDYNEIMRNNNRGMSDAFAYYEKMGQERYIKPQQKHRRKKRRRRK